MNLLLYGIVALGILGMLGTIGYKVRQAGYDAAKLECAEAAAVQRKTEEVQASKAAVTKERADAKSKVVYRTIREEVERVVDRVEYRDRPCLDDAGLRVAADAIRGATSRPAAESDGAVRAPAAAGRGDGKGGPAVDR